MDKNSTPTSSDPRVIDLTYDQMMELRRKTCYVAYRYKGGKWQCYLMLLGGRSERQVRNFMSLSRKR